MKTDFNRAREWRLAQKVSAVILFVIIAIRILVAILASRTHDGISLAIAVVSLAVCVTGIGIWRNLRCPHCGNSVMSAWTGRDGAKRNCIRSVESRSPVICARCGEEVDTNA